MNFAQFGMFFVFLGSVFIPGVYLHYFLSDRDSFKINKAVFLGESLLLGSTLLYAAIMLLGMCHLYTKLFLWGATLINFLFLISKHTRRQIWDLIKIEKFKFSFPFTIFILLMIWFVFRNCFFLVDVDSHSTYLLTQKLWLTFKKITVADPGIDARFFIPQFDTIFYGLGLSVYPQETLFPQLINIFWRVVCLLLVYGYTSYRFNKYYGLAASMFLMFNLHFYISGANHWVIMNPAIIAFIFAATYSFWESRRNLDFNRFFLAIIFLSQLPSNKYQSAFIFIFLLILGIFIQPSPWSQLKELFFNKKRLCFLIGFFLVAALILIKNWIATKLPTFPIFAGKFGILNRHPQMDQIFRAYARGVTLNQFFKYVGFLFIWAGIIPAKYVFITIISTPLIILRLWTRKTINIDKTIELFYWLSTSTLCLLGICFVTHQDPRYYGYAIAVFTFAAIFSIDFVVTQFLCIRNKFVLCTLILLLASQGHRIFLAERGFFVLPTIKENIAVLTDKIHTKDVIPRYFLHHNWAMMGYAQNLDKVQRSAWDYSQGGTNYSPFLVPVRPQISLWWTSIIRWTSYAREDLVVRDLKAYGIDYIMRIKDSRLVFTPVAEYAKDAVKFNRFPTKTQFDYGFPAELTVIKYKNRPNQ